MRPEIKNRAARRLKIAAGQIRGVAQMIAEEKYCVDIITQIDAARAALGGVADLLLENHLATHVAHQMKHGQEKQATAEVVKVYQLARQR